MTPEAEGSSIAPPAGLSEMSRLSGVFFEPTATFEDIAARPRWFVPMLLIILAACGFLTVFTQRVGWEGVVREQMEKSPQMQQMPADQRERSIAMGARFGAISGFAGTVIGIPIANLVIAGILLGVAAGILSAPVKFKQVFSILCYAGLPSILSSLLATVVLILKPENFNLRNPLMFNPAAAMDPLTTSKFVYSLASSIDLFSFWVIFLIATGLKAAGGKKLSFGGALFAVLLPWGIYVLGKSSLAGMFG